MPATRPPHGRPLDGVTVVEFATIIAAPLATSMLADLGARVVKVELIDGDPYRHLVAAGTPAAKTTAGKSSICIDLKQEDGSPHRPGAGGDGRRRRAQRPPGVPERLGLGDAAAARPPPELIWVSLTGYGPHARARIGRPRIRAPARRPVAPGTSPAPR